MHYMATIQVRLPNDEKAAAEKLAEEAGASVSQWIRDMIRAARGDRRIVAATEEAAPKYMPPKTEKMHSAFAARQPQAPAPDVSTLGPLCEKGCGCYGGLRSIQCKVGWNCPCHGKGTPGVCGFCGATGDRKHLQTCPNREG